MNDNKEVLIPIWVLKTKVEADFQEYMFYHEHELEANEPEDHDDVLDTPDPFPEYDSTMKMLEVLEKEGIEFDKKTGLWKE